MKAFSFHHYIYEYMCLGEQNESSERNRKWYHTWTVFITLYVYFLCMKFVIFCFQTGWLLWASPEYCPPEDDSSDWLHQEKGRVESARWCKYHSAEIVGFLTLSLHCIGLISWSLCQFIKSVPLIVIRFQFSFR